VKNRYCRSCGVEVSCENHDWRRVDRTRYVAHGERKEASLKEARRPCAKHRYVLPDGMAYIYPALRDYDRALESLGKAYNEHADAMTLLKVEPRFDPLRSDPRFVKLPERVNLPPLT